MLMNNLCIVTICYLQAVKEKWGDDPERLRKMSVVEETSPKMIRMALLATIGSHTVNGVAEIHSGLIKARLFPEFVELTPDIFQNKTNGVTPRRWLLVANPCLSQVRFWGVVGNTNFSADR